MSRQDERLKNFVLFKMYATDDEINNMIPDEKGSVVKAIGIIALVVAIGVAFVILT